ncbi:MAG: dienelactone hydrolase family protein [Sciscionella sp.]
MTETRTETPQLTDGRTLRLTVAEPENVVRGGLVVLHEARGVTDGVRFLVGSLADEGWLAVAPHIYRDVDEVDHEQAGAAIRSLSGESVLADTDAACLWLADRGVSADLIGVMGFDLGGSVALVVAASRQVGAAVSVNGGGISTALSDGLPALVDIAGELTCPWLGIYGGADTEISSDEVEKLREAVTRSEIATEVVRFSGAEHRFDTDPQTSAEAWHRTLNWFDAHLR